MTEDIDSDTPVAVLFAPSVDLDSAAVQKLNDFLSNGGDYGKTLIFVANSSYMEDTPILDSFLKEWGMELSKGYIAEMDSSHMPSANNPFASVFDFANDNFTAGLKNASIPMASVYTRPVNILDEKQPLRCLRAQNRPLFTRSTRMKATILQKKPSLRKTPRPSASIPVTTRNPPS